jgi:hypothetical protein
MNDPDREQCRCNAQFTNSTCAEYFVSTNEEVDDNTPSIGTPYKCPRTPHAMLTIDGSPATPEILTKFKKLVPRAPRSSYRPIPIIHSLSPLRFSEETATSSLTEFLALADASSRKTPMLWLGPTAGGHNNAKNQKSTSQIWEYDAKMAKAAAGMDIEVLKMYNMTAQANSFGGNSFGEKVAITQAMMVVNWLSRLESS